MTSRERFLDTLLFGKPDRIPFTPGGPRESTRAAWHAQGLPEDRDYMDVVHGLVDGRRAERGNQGNPACRSSAFMRHVGR